MGKPIISVLRNASYTPIERKSRVHQIQGVRERSCSKLPRVLGNEGKGVSPAFPTCWVVAESEAQRVNKMGNIFSNYISFMEEVPIIASIHGLDNIII